MATPANARTGFAAGVRPGGLRAAGFWLVAAAPLLLGAGDSFEERAKRIEEMTAVERAALEYNFKSFQTLSDADRRKYEQLDRELREDKDGLERVLQNYAEWLKALPIEKREELRAAADATARMQLVRRIREEQDAKKSQPVSPPAALPLAGLNGRLGPLATKANPEEFKALMSVIERRGGIPADKRAEWEKLSPAQRHLRVLQWSVHLSEERDEKFPDETLARELMANLPDELLSRRIREQNRPELQRQLLALHLIRGLAMEWQSEIESRRPDEIELQKFFGKMEDSRRAEIMRMPRDAAERQIVWQYFEQQSGEFGDDLKEFRRLMQRALPREGNRPPGEGRPPGPHGKPGERPPPGDRPPPPPSDRPSSGGKKSPEGRPDR